MEFDAGFWGAVEKFGVSVAFGGVSFLLIIWIARALIGQWLSQQKSLGEYLLAHATNAALQTKSLDNVASALQSLVSKVEGDIAREDERHRQNQEWQRQWMAQQSQFWDEFYSSVKGGMTPDQRQLVQKRESAKRLSKRKVSA